MGSWGTTKNSANAPHYWVDAGNGVTANGKIMYANTLTGAFVTHKKEGVFGVDNQQINDTAQDQHKAAHSGWHLRKEGVGPIINFSIATPGQGVNANGFLVFSGTDNINLNVSYVTCNTANVLQLNSTNSTLNGVGTIAINNFSNELFNAAPSITLSGSSTVAPTFNLTIGGNAGRVSYECLVATGNVA
jgi:hypothetical protein